MHHVKDLQMLKFFEGLPRVKMEQQASKSPEPRACRPDAPDEKSSAPKPGPSAIGSQVRPLPTPCRAGPTRGVKREAQAGAGAVEGSSPKRAKLAPKALSRQDFC